MTALKKVSETCEEQLRRMCVDIADSITKPDQQVYEWMEDTYNINYLVDSSNVLLLLELWQCNLKLCYLMNQLLH